jgi:hypothetical protein
MLNGQTFYVENFTLEGVRKMLNGKLHHPPYSASSKYVLITHSARVFQSGLYGTEFRVFLMNIHNNNVYKTYIINIYMYIMYVYIGHKGTQQAYN